MCNEMIQILLVGFDIQSFAADPFDSVLLEVGCLDSVWYADISEISKQFAGFCVQATIQYVHVQGCFLQILWIYIVDVAKIRQAMVLGIFHIQNTVDNLSLSDCKMFEFMIFAINIR